MASFDAYVDDRTIRWTISGLSNPFNTTYYLYAGIYGTQCSSGQSTAPSPAYSGVSAPTSGSNNFVSGSWLRNYGDSYTLYPAIRAANGLWYPAGSSVYVEVLSGRPYDWNWYSTIAVGQPIALSYREWNDFCIKINDFRAYKSLSQYPFTTVARGYTITANIVNQAWAGILGMAPPVSVPPSAVAGVTVISASFFNGLKNSLNSIL